MFTDAQLAPRLKQMIVGINVPPAPVAVILSQASRPHAIPRRDVPWARVETARRAAVLAGVVVGVLIFATPFVAPSIAQTLQARIAQLLQWTPPPPAPKSVRSAMVSREVSLKEAQALVPFHIVAPAGLPRDAVFEKLVATPTGVYSKATHSWSVGAPSLMFSYRRPHGREFSLLVDSYDPRTGSPPKYIFNADEIGADGLPKRYSNFAWRNGGQITSILQDATISAAEIETIRVAMHGTPLHLVYSRAGLGAGSIVKQYAAPR